MHIINSDGQAGLGSILEPKRLKFLQELHGPFLPDTLVAFRYQIRKGSLIHLSIQALEFQLQRQDLTEKNATDRGGHNILAHPYANTSLEPNLLGIVCDANFLGIRKQFALAETPPALLGHVITAHDDVLAGYCQRLTVGS